MEFPIKLSSQINAAEGVINKLKVVLVQRALYSRNLKTHIEQIFQAF